MNIKIKLLPNGKLPVFAHEQDACADCYSTLEKGFLISPNGRCLIPLGFALELPAGYEAVLRPRSGLSKKGIDIAIGTIDCGYTGEVSACVINNSPDVFAVTEGMRICQMAVRKTEEVSFEIVDNLSESERGSNGFGSTGLN